MDAAQVVGGIAVDRVGRARIPLAEGIAQTYARFLANAGEWRG